MFHPPGSPDATTPTSPVTTAGPANIVKRGWADRGDRMRHEAGVLADAAHPGVVEVESVVDDLDSCEIHLVTVEGPTLAELDPLPLDELLRLLAGIGRTLHDLHLRGIRHGNIRSDHVLVDPRGRTVLCGFGDAGRHGEPDAPTVTDDIAAFGRLALGELGRSETTHVIGADDRTAWALRSLAEHAATVDPGDEPALDDYLDRLGRLASGTAESADEWRISPTTARFTAAAAAFVLLAGVAVWLLRGDDIAAETAADVPAMPQVSTPGTLVNQTSVVTSALTRPATPTSPTPSLVHPVERAVGCAPIAPGVVDLDGDGCSDEVVIAGGDVMVNGLRWRVGEPDDVIVLGDWDCSGAATPAMLRSATGDIFFFTRWPGPGEPITVEATARLEGATGISVDQGPPGSSRCDLVAVDATPGHHIGLDGEVQP